MTQAAWTRHGRLLDAQNLDGADWETLKRNSTLDDFVLPCCGAPAVLKTSVNGLPFFAHISGECAPAPETKWHQDGKAGVLAALAGLGIAGWDEVPGTSPAGAKWEADVLFSVAGRIIAIELQRSYQHLRDFRRRQERYATSSVDCFWLVRMKTFLTLGKATSRLPLKRDFGNVFPSGGIGTGALPELPVSMLESEPVQRPVWRRPVGNPASVADRNSRWNLPLPGRLVEHAMTNPEPRFSSQYAIVLNRISGRQDREPDIATKAVGEAGWTPRHSCSAMFPSAQKEA